MSIFKVKPKRIVIEWRRFYRGRLKHALQRKILTEGKTGTSILMGKALCGVKGDFDGVKHGGYAKCSTCKVLEAARASR